MELPKASEIALLASTLAPGLIVLSIRSRFKEGVAQDFKDQVLAFAVASAAYYAAIFPVFHYSQGVSIPSWLWQFLQFFVVPLFVGIGIAKFDETGSFYKISRKLGLRPSHHIPSAWDYAFSTINKGTYVLVKLSDGTLYAGIMGKTSFASSSSAERDLLIEEVWSVEKEGTWRAVTPRRAVLLCGKDIRWVEIFARSA